MPGSKIDLRSPDTGYFEKKKVATRLPLFRNTTATRLPPFRKTPATRLPPFQKTPATTFSKNPGLFYSITLFINDIEDKISKK